MDASLETLRFSLKTPILSLETPNFRRIHPDSRWRLRDFHFHEISMFLFETPNSRWRPPDFHWSPQIFQRESGGLQRNYGGLQ